VTNNLPSFLAGFLYGLCVSSRAHFPQGGLQVRAVSSGTEAPTPPDGESASRELVMEYLACALGDTTRSNPEEAREATDGLFAALAGAYPGARLHLEVGENRGWFDQFQIWAILPDNMHYIWLDWSVS
jgi:hypothetical protein